MFFPFHPGIPEIVNDSSDCLAPNWFSKLVSGQPRFASTENWDLVTCESTESKS